MQTGKVASRVIESEIVVKVSCELWAFGFVCFPDTWNARNDLVSRGTTTYQNMILMADLSLAMFNMPANTPRLITLVGYLLDSPSPYRLWFRFDLPSGVKDSIQGNGLDCQGLLHEAKEELAAAF